MFSQLFDSTRDLVTVQLRYDGTHLKAMPAALMAIVEMTHNPNIISPAMLVIVIANITVSEPEA